RMIASTFFMALAWAGVVGDRKGCGRGSAPLRFGQRVGMDVRAARHRHEVLRLPPPAVLADVEPVQLVARADTQTDGLLDRPEAREGKREDGDERDAHCERLRAELTEAPRVDEPALANRVELRQHGIGEETARQGAQIPARPCALSAPTGSSSHLSMASTPYTTITPATAPMTIAAHGSTYPDGAVIATSAAMAPLPIMPTSSDFWIL